MKLKYPAEAFALGIILFSAGKREAFAAGILVILAVVFAEFLKNLLETFLPGWSLKLCVYVATGSLCSSVFLVSFAVLGTLLDNGTWVMAFVIGLLAAHRSLSGEIGAQYGELFLESAIAWGFWILLAIFREFAGSGAIFGNTLFTAGFQSKAFLEVTFAFLAAGLVLAFTNGILKKECKTINSLFVFVPAVLLFRPFAMHILGETAGLIWTILVPIVMFLSVKVTLKFSSIGKAYRGLPADMLAAGFIYMILSIY